MPFTAILGFPLGCVAFWILLLIVVLLAQKLADFALPPWPETMLKLGVIAVLVNTLTAGLDMVNVWLSWIGGAALFWALIVKWFEVDPFGALMIIAVARPIGRFLAFLSFELTEPLM